MRIRPNKSPADLIFEGENMAGENKPIQRLTGSIGVDAFRTALI